LLNYIARLKKNQSEPFLTGDLFASKADVSLYSHNFLDSPASLKEVEAAKVIFCPSDKVIRFFEEYGKVVKASVLIFGNSDFDWNEIPDGVPKSVKKIYAQNVNFKSTKMTPLPIGIENSKLNNNGKPKYFSRSLQPLGKWNQILVGPFSDTNPERRILAAALVDQDFPKIDILLNRISPKRYARIAPKYQFIACPRGNGLDTHRFWESLYRNCHPVVLRSNWSTYWKNIGVPLFEVERWHESDLNRVLTSDGLGFERESVLALWWPYWEKEIRLHL